jgi:phosphoenolpyruvate carboxykinase (ATP)
MNLDKYGLFKSNCFYQTPIDKLQEIIVSQKHGVIVDSGALAINTGKFTGRSPKDRYIVKDSTTNEKVWWGDINIPIDESCFEKLYLKITNYLAEKDVYVRDSYVCSLDTSRLNVRTICELPSSDFFANNMFLRLEKKILKNFQEDWLLINAPGFKSNPKTDGTRSENFAIINFSKKIIIIGGTGYTGEIKKSIFSVLNFLLPVDQGILPMHCSANVGKDEDTAIFFGLSGTGKTTLSADPSRQLIGDDEHGWSKKNQIFNFEGGCYAKVINLNKESEPDIYNAIKKGSLLENIIVDKNGKVDFTNTLITQNTRVSYPIDFIKNIKKPSIGNTPKNIFFLTADAFGVLPPISKLSASQAAYHFISGYTSKVAGTEAGVVEPQPSFSACFGAPFMPLHPTEYAQMLIKKINESGVKVWLVNTGWTGGPYGIGKRMELKYTRAMINAALSGELEEANKNNYHIHSVFNLKQPRICPNVPTSVLSPRKTWNDDENYYKTAFKLANSFVTNFKQFESYSNDEIMSGAPNGK